VIRGRIRPAREENTENENIKYRWVSPKFPKVKTCVDSQDVIALGSKEAIRGVFI